MGLIICPECSKEISDYSEVCNGCGLPLREFQNLYLKIIGQSIIIDNIEVAQNNFIKQMNWYDAKKACESLGKGWRLPDKEELNFLYQNKSQIEFIDGFYWSSSLEENMIHAWSQCFIFGEQNADDISWTAFVRAIKVV